MTTRRAVLLDVDGTLLASNEEHASAWSDAARAFGFARAPEFFRPLIGMGADRVLPRISLGLSDASEPGKSIAAESHTIYQADYFPNIRPTKGARALVKRFHDEGWTCVIATSATKDELDAALNRIDICEFIDAAAEGHDAPSSKPAPDIVLAALRKAKLEPNEAFILGDTPYDVLSAFSAGVPAVALRSGGWRDGELAGAHAIYDDPQEMLERFDWKERSLKPRANAS